MNTKTHNKQT